MAAATGGAPVARSELRDGLRDILPVLIAAIPIGMLFGALAAGKGLSVAESTLMSALVFAGGSQFAAVDLWTYPVPIAAIVFSTLLINARHVLMAVSLTPKMKFPYPLRFVAFFFLTDETWALAERHALGRPVVPAYWFGLALLLPVIWVGSTIFGAWLGTLLGDPSRLGADFAFTALFIGLVAGFWRGRVTTATIAASGIAAAITYATVGPPWHVAVGAFAGIAAAYLAAGPTEARR